MSAREEAIELVEIYKNHSTIWIDENECYTSIKKAKEAALICVDKILKSHYKLLSGVNTTIYKHYQEVKEEIQKL
jgi:hypothetical protein